MGIIQPKLLNKVLFGQRPYVINGLTFWRFAVLTFNSHDVLPFW